MHANTEGVATDMLTAPWLRRSVVISEVPQEPALVLNELQVKICLNTYKLFYLVNTEDTLVRRKVNRVVEPNKFGHNRATRTANGKKWTQDGYRTKEEQNAAAAAAAEAREHVAPHPPTLGTGISQTSPPPASSTTPIPQPDLQRSTDPTPNPPVVEDPVSASDVKVESPPLPAESSDAMDIESMEPTRSVIPERTIVDSNVVDEDVEMADA